MSMVRYWRTMLVTSNGESGDIRLEFFCLMFSVIRGPIRRNKDDFFLGNPFMQLRDEQKGIWPCRKRECGQNRKRYLNI